MGDLFEGQLVDVDDTVTVFVQPTPEIAEAIGRVSIAAAQFEYVMRLFVKTVLWGGFENAMIVTSRTSLSDLHTIILALLQKDNATAVIDAYSDHAGIGMKLVERRNEYVHGFLAKLGDGAPIVVTVKRDAKKGLGSVPILAIEFNVEV